MGADVSIDPTEVDPVAAVLEQTKGAGAEVVLEMSGNANAIDQGTRMLARGGRMSLLGLPDASVALDLNDQVIFKEARLQGITGREMFRTWQQTTTLLSTGRVDVSPVITHRFGFDRWRGSVRDHGLGPVRQGDPRSGRRCDEHDRPRLDFLKEELAALERDGLRCILEPSRDRRAPEPATTGAT